MSDLKVELTTTLFSELAQSVRLVIDKSVQGLVIYLGITSVSLKWIFDKQAHPKLKNILRFLNLGFTLGMIVFSWIVAIFLDETVEQMRSLLKYNELKEKVPDISYVYVSVSMLSFFLVVAFMAWIMLTYKIKPNKENNHEQHNSS